MSEKRVKWTGDTSTVAFVFEFHFEEDREVGDFPLLDNYEVKHPGEIDSLYQHYLTHEKKWHSGKVKLKDNQLAALHVLIASVNQWHEEASPFFAGMKPSWLIREVIDGWDKKDKKGLARFRSSADWWLDDPDRGELPMWNLITDRVVDEFDEDSFFGQVFYEMGSNQDFLGALNFFFQHGSPYHQNDYFYSEEEPSKKEMKEIQEFFASDQILCDFKSFYDDHKDEWRS
jgi:hypothetical protein